MAIDLVAPLDCWPERGRGRVLPAAWQVPGGVEGETGRDKRSEFIYTKKKQDKEEYFQPENFPVDLYVVFPVRDEICG